MSSNTASLTNYYPKIPPRHSSDYADIINRSRPLPANPLSPAARAAQFSPYAALTGYDQLISADEASTDSTFTENRIIIEENFD